MTVEGLRSQPTLSVAENTPTTSSTTSLKIALFNIRSLKEKTLLTKGIITSYSLDCILLTETWLDDSGSKELIEASPPNSY